MHFFSFIGTLYFGPILFQAVFGASSTSSGIRLIPYMALLIVGSVGSGFLLPRFRRLKYYLMFGAASNLLGYGLFFTVNENSNWGQQACYLTFCGRYTIDLKNDTAFYSNVHHVVYPY